MGTCSMNAGGRSSWFAARSTTCRRGNAATACSCALGWTRFVVPVSSFGQEIVRAEDTSAVLTESLVTAVWIGPNRRPMRVPESVRRGLIGMAPPDLPMDDG